MISGLLVFRDFLPHPTLPFKDLLFELLKPISENFLKTPNRTILSLFEVLHAFIVPLLGCLSPFILCYDDLRTHLFSPLGSMELPDYWHLLDSFCVLHVTCSYQ